MLKIAVCDDDIKELSQISNLLNKYRLEKEYSFKQEVFSNPMDLLDAFTAKSYDIIFLDLIMPELTGIDTAREIRRVDEEVKIIFLTSSAEFAVDSYSVNAYYYLLKPAKAETLFPIMDKLFLETQKNLEFITLKTASGFIKLAYIDIIYVEVFNKKLNFHLSNNQIKEINGNLSDYENNFISRDEFIKTHRSYIINMKYISSFSTKSVVMEGKQDIPISRLLYSSVKATYMEYLFLEKGVQ